MLRRRLFSSPSLQIEPFFSALPETSAKLCPLDRQQIAAISSCKAIFLVDHNSLAKSRETKAHGKGYVSRQLPFAT